MNLTKEEQRQYMDIIKTEIAHKARQHTFDFVLETLQSDGFVDRLHEEFWNKNNFSKFTVEDKIAGDTMFYVLIGIIAQIGKMK